MTRPDIAYQTRYESSPKQKRRRALRNKARRMMLRAGKVHKGDEMDVHHLGGMEDVVSNLRVIHRKKNRGYRRGPRNQNRGL